MIWAHKTVSRPDSWNFVKYLPCSQPWNSRFIPTSSTPPLFLRYYYERNPHSAARRIHRRHFNYDIVFSRQQLKRFLYVRKLRIPIGLRRNFQTDSNKRLFWEQNAIDAPTKTWNSKCVISIWDSGSEILIQWISMKKIANCRLQ